MEPTEAAQTAKHAIEFTALADITEEYAADAAKHERGVVLHHKEIIEAVQNEPPHTGEETRRSNELEYHRREAVHNAQLAGWAHTLFDDMKAQLADADETTKEAAEDAGKRILEAERAAAASAATAEDHAKNAFLGIRVLKGLQAVRSEMRKRVGNLATRSRSRH